MVSHVDKLRTDPATKEYRDNHERIFGPPKGAGKVDEATRRRMRAEHHNKLVADGKKDAQYYLDHEVRVAQNPNFIAQPDITEEYRLGWDEIIGKTP